jgi:phosphoglycolate phosphatase
VAGDPLHRAGFEHGLRTVFGVTATLDGLLLGGRSDLAIAAESLARAGVAVSVDDPRLVRALEVMGRYFTVRLGDEDRSARVLPGVPEVLRKLGARGVAVALATGSARVVAQAKLAGAGLGDFFAAGAYGDEAADRAVLLQRALGRASDVHGRRFLAANAVVVGDTPADIAAARAVGARVVAVATGRYRVEELDEHGPDATFADLTNADAVVRAIHGG